MSTISRQEYDRMKVAEIRESARMFNIPRTEMGAQDLFDGAYPKSSAQALEELNERGFAASEWRLDRYCKFPELAPQIIGNTRLWTKEAIDKIAAHMEELGTLTIEAQWRKAHGLSYGQEQELLRIVKQQRKEAANASSN